MWLGRIVRPNAIMSLYDTFLLHKTIVGFVLAHSNHFTLNASDYFSPPPSPTGSPCYRC